MISCQIPFLYYVIFMSIMFDLFFSIISGLVEEALSGQDSPNVTSRLLKRANMIIEAVQEHKVIFDLSKLQKVCIKNHL